MKLKNSILAIGLSFAVMTGTAQAQSAANLNDLEIAHVAYIADNVDIKIAHLALGISDNSEIHDFAQTMIRDHIAVNEQALALLAKLKADPKDNFLSQTLLNNSVKTIDTLRQLRGKEFDIAYAKNELAYHKAVNDLIENAFIPNIENVEVKALFGVALKIFKAHQNHAAMMVKKVSQ